MDICQSPWCRASGETARTHRVQPGQVGTSVVTTTGPLRHKEEEMKEHRQPARPCGLPPTCQSAHVPCSQLSHVLLLVGGQRVDVDAHRRQLRAWRRTPRPPPAPGGPRCGSLPLFLTQNSVASACVAKLMSMTLGRVALGRGQVDEPALAEHVEPLAVLQLVLVDVRRGRPSSICVDLGLQGDAGRARRRSGRCCRPSRRPSSSAKCSRRMTCLLPVTVMNRSPILAASAIGMTAKPSIAASRARIGSTSVTMTCAPRPRARSATPLPHQP